jgi:uncharacterized protein YkwD
MSTIKMDRTIYAWRAVLGAVCSIGLVAVLIGCGSSNNPSSNDVAATVAAEPSASSVTATHSAASTTSGGLAEKALAQINAVRASARICGAVPFAAAAPLSWNAKLEVSAAAQAHYMQSIGALSHVGANNVSLGARVTAAGYPWRQLGENIAYGHTTIEDTIQGWVDSPGHCAILMNADYKDVGVAFDAGDGSATAVSYWALVLATQ